MGKALLCKNLSHMREKGGPSIIWDRYTIHPEYMPKQACICLACLAYKDRKIERYGSAAGWQKSFEILRARGQLVQFVSGGAD